MPSFKLPSGKFSLSSLRIGPRLFLGTGTILALLGVVTLAAYIGLSGSASSFGEYRKLARQTKALATVQSEVAMTRFYLKDFLTTGSDERAAMASEQIEAIDRDGNAAMALFESQERKEQLGEVVSMMREYESAFGSVLAIDKKTDALMSEITTDGIMIERNLSEVMRGAEREANVSAAYGAGETLRSLMLARVYVAKFIDDNDKASVERVRNELADALERAATIRAALRNPARQQLVGETIDLMKVFGTNFDAYQAAIFERNAIVSAQLDRLGPAAAATLNEMTADNNNRQDELGPQATAAINQAIWIALLVAGIAIAAGAVISLLLTRSIAGPVNDMTDTMQELSDGNLDVKVPGIGRGDEIGDMADTVRVFKEALIDKRAADEAAAKENAAKAKRSAELDRLTKDFDAQVSQLVNAVSSSATELQATAQTLTATAEETSSQSTAVAAASEQATVNVQTVATASEELATSISEISRQVAQSAGIANKAAADAETTNQQVQALADTAQKIGEVVDLINDIASQTNLLALNATIEAARAGEAGKGFAVVASEVKSLASATAKATDEITDQITGVQKETLEAVKAIQSIGATIGQINEIAAAIAAAVEEQGAATQEIARNVQQAAVGTQEVSSNISGVNQAASETGAAATQVLSASGELAERGDALRNQVDSFLRAVQAA